MSFISPKLIARIYQALGQDRASDAVLLLRQHAFLTRFCPAMDNEFMAEVVRMADQNFGEGDLERAEEHYELGLALYQSCFTKNHAEALRCISGLLGLRQARHDSQGLLSLLDLNQQICSAMRRELYKPKAVVLDNAA